MTNNHKIKIRQIKNSKMEFIHSSPPPNFVNDENTQSPYYQKFLSKSSTKPLEQHHPLEDRSVPFDFRVLLPPVRKRGGLSLFLPPSLSLLLSLSFSVSLSLSRCTHA